MAVLNSTRWSIAAVAALAAVLGLWALLSPSSEPAERANDQGVEDDDDDDDEKHTAADEPAAPRPRKAELPRPASQAAPMASTSDDGVVGPHPDDPHLPGMKPHPMTPEHERIFTENRLIQSLNDAMSIRNVKAMREMLVEYRRLDPTDVDKNQIGYEVIADCIEFPGDPSLAAARRFYDTERHSPLRRFVRRICFENSN